MGSLSELETQLDIAKMLGFCNENEETTKRIHFIKNMLSRLIASLNNKKAI